jgi:uncharacterized membrane protein YjjP (DUF1212 family)
MKTFSYIGDFVLATVLTFLATELFVLLLIGLDHILIYEFNAEITTFIIGGFAGISFTSFLRAFNKATEREFPAK